MAHPNLGGFLILNNLRPIIDDRNTLNGEEAYKEFFQKMKPNENVIPFLNQSQATHVLLPAGSPLYPFLKKHPGFSDIRCEGFYLLAIG